MIRILIVWLINTISLLLLPYLMTSIRLSGFWTALIAALVLGLVNALIRPILVLLTLPMTFITLGLFIFVINGIMFYLVSKIVSGFEINGFLSAIGGALLYSIISWALSSLILNK